MDMPPLAFGGDFLGGFQGESENIRKTNADKQEKIDARNAKVFETLANADDPDIRAAAVTGLLTGQHPAKGMDKWFGKVSEHPIYETIKGLVSEGHEPFMDPAKRHSVEVGNDFDAKMGAIGRSGLTPDDQRRAKMGAFGAPPPRALAAQPGTIHLKDGTTTAGFFDPNEGAYYDENYQPISEAVSFTRGSAENGSASAGGKWSAEKDATSSTGWRQVHRDTAGNVLGKGGETAAPGGPPSFNFIPTPGGIVTGNTRTGEIRNAPGGEGVQRPAPAGADVNAIREVESSILRLHPQPKPIFSGGQVAPEKLQAWRTAVDAEAKNYGYDSFQALQQALGGAAGNVGDQTPPPQVPPGLGAKPEAKAAPKPPKGQANTGKSKIDVNAILSELSKARQGVAGSAGAPAPAR